MSESHGHHVCRVDELIYRLLYEILRLVPCQGCNPENMTNNYIDSSMNTFLYVTLFFYSSNRIFSWPLLRSQEA
jgi:hypothetical protein